MGLRHRRIVEQRPTLGIVSAEGESRAAESGELSADMTLPAFFGQYIVPEHLSERSRKTVRDYWTTVSYWVEFLRSPSAPLGPGLNAIGQRETSRFRDGLKNVKFDGQPLADNTRRKHCTNLQFILDRAGPKLRRDVETAKLIADVPYLQRPALVIHEVADNFSLAEIGWFLDACSAAPAPHGLAISSAAFWRCLGLFDYNVGARPQTLLALKFRWLSQDEYGWWLSVPPEASKTKRGLKLYVNTIAMQLVERMRACGDELIFPWPHEEGWLHTTRRKILAASLIPEHRRLGFKAFRKACGTQLAEINPMAAQLQLGHGGRNVTRDFYVNRKIVAKACEALPQPQWCQDFGERQLTLF
jgi:integrase